MNLSSDETISTTAEYRCLENGKYRGVVVQSVIGRFSTDDFQIDCINERDSKEEAIEDAKKLAFT